MTKKQSVVFSLLLITTLVLAACSSAGGDTTATQAPGVSDPGSGALSTPAGLDTPLQTQPAMTAEVVTAAPGDAPPPAGETGFPTPAGVGLSGTETVATPAVTTEPLATESVATEAPATEAMTTEVVSTQTMTDTLRGAEIVPAEARADLILLSNWNGFSVADQNEQVIGQVQDYIINMCEAHILYMVVSNDSGAAQGGAELLIPYEAVSVNGGSLNAETRTITLALTADQLAGAPTLEQRPDLTSVDWEGDVRGFWGDLVSLSSLDTSCSVAVVPTQTVDGAPEGVNVQKLAYASSLPGATLADGNQNVLGQVQDAVIEPESGQLFYLAIARQDDQGLVLVPLGAVNVAEAAAEPGAGLSLVLLVDNSVLQNAPTIDSLDALATNVDPAANDYWSQHIQMGPTTP